MSFSDQMNHDLAAKLPASAVKSREQGGRKVSYIEGWHVIAEANRIFGFDNWTRETMELRCVSEKACRTSARFALSLVEWLARAAAPATGSIATWGRLTSPR